MPCTADRQLTGKLSQRREYRLLKLKLSCEIQMKPRTIKTLTAIFSYQNWILIKFEIISRIDQVNIGLYERGRHDDHSSVATERWRQIPVLELVTIKRQTDIHVQCAITVVAKETLFNHCIHCIVCCSMTVSICTFIAMIWVDIKCVTLARSSESLVHLNCPPPLCCPECNQYHWKPTKPNYQPL